MEFSFGKCFVRWAFAQGIVVLPRIIWKDAYQEGPKFHRGNIFAYWEYGLSFCDTHRTGWNPTTVLWIWNQWIADGHIEQYTGPQRPPITNTREVGHIVKSALQSLTTTSRTINHETDILSVLPIIYLYDATMFSSAWTDSLKTVHCQLQNVCEVLLRLPLTMHHRERQRLWCTEPQRWL